MALIAGLVIGIRHFTTHGLVRNRHSFIDGSQSLTVVVREKPNDGMPIDIFAWSGILRVGRYTYWLDLCRGEDTIATTDYLDGDTYRARTVRVVSADRVGAVIDLGTENGETSFEWRYK